MKSAVEQLATYKSVHLNPSNIKTHFVGVPLIIWSIMLLCSLVRLPVDVPLLGNSLTLAACLTLVVVTYYFVLHIPLAVGMSVFMGICLYLAHIVSLHPLALEIALAVFVIAWVVQFIGHHYEKAKPAFIDDLNQLFIGPLFLMAEVYFMVGWQKPLEDEITPIARDLRRALEKKRKGE